MLRDATRSDVSCRSTSAGIRAGVLSAWLLTMAIGAPSGLAGQEVEPDGVLTVKSPQVAWALSFFLPGAGHIYNGHGQVWRGVAHLAVAEASFVVMASRVFCGDECGGEAAAAAALVFVGNWVWAQASAYEGAKRINQAATQGGTPANSQAALRLGRRTVRSFTARTDITLLTWHPG